MHQVKWELIPLKKKKKPKSIHNGGEIFLCKMVHQNSLLSSLANKFLNVSTSD
jgi:hypothetical protein